MRLFLRGGETDVSMENKLKYANYLACYGSIRSFARVSGDAKPSENQV